MYSLEYANSLVSVDLAQVQMPAVLIIHPVMGVPQVTEQPGRIVAIQPPMMIGREAKCQVQLPDKFLSRVHCTITQPTEYWIHDGDARGKVSANGIFVNRLRLQSAQELNDEDQIQLGVNIKATFHKVRVPTGSDHLNHLPLGDLLREAHLISASQLSAAMRAKDQSPMLLGEILMQKGWISPQTLEFMLHLNEISLAIPTGRSPVGEYLKLAGLVTENQIQEALQYLKRHRLSFGMALVELNSISESTLDFFLKRYEHLDASMGETAHISTLA